MSYALTTPQPSGLQDGETAVTLDTGDVVAVAATGSIDPVSGSPIVSATARVLNADGTTKVVEGTSLQSTWSHKSYTAEVANLGSGDSVAGMAVLQKCCLMAVLGEDTSPMWIDPIHYTAMQDASIRTHISSAAHAGPVNAAALL